MRRPTSSCGANLPTGRCRLARRAAELLRALPPQAIAEYERRYGPDAQRLLAESSHAVDSTACRELLRRFEFTRAGAEALRRAANRAFDCGRFVEAARLYERWMAHPSTADSPDAGERLRAETAALLAADIGHVAAYPRPDDHSVVRYNDRAQPIEAWRCQIRRGASTRRLGRPRRYRCTTGGSLWATQRRTGCRTGTVPTIDPLWSASHADAPSQATGVQTVSYESAAPGAKLLEHWMESRADRRLPRAGATFALVDSGWLIVRDFQGVTARNLRTGEAAWRFACESGLSRRAALARAASKAAATPDPPIAATLMFNEFFAQNSALGMLASNGQYVFCVDLHPQSDTVSASKPGRRSNRLLALAMDIDGLEPGSLAWQTEKDGRFYLGAPLPTEEGLYAIAERDSLVSLVALAPETGELRWEQPISLVDAAINNDPQRARQACTPTLAGGILVCPTQLGTIVGVNARSGALEWVYRYAETNGPSQPWRKTRAFDREYGAPEYPNLPMIVGGTILVLAPQSQYVHGIDLYSGQQRWKEPRGQAQYVATAGDELALLVGPRRCRALRIADGGEVWSQTIKTPAGRGLALGDAFLLPTEDGRIQSIDVRTGRIAPDLLPQTGRTQSTVLRVGGGVGLEPDPRPDAGAYSGNLLCSGEFVVSCSPAGVAVYPQAGVVLEALIQESRTQPLSGAAWLERGELELRLGNVRSAEESLWNVLAEKSSPQTRTLAELRLRELMYAQLAAGDQPQQRLASLERLSRRPVDRARHLAHKLNHELQSDDPAAASRTAVALAELGIGQPVAMDARGEYAVVPQRYASAAIVRTLRKAPVEMRRAIREEAIDPAADGMLDVAEFGTSTAANRAARAAHINALIADGRYQAAELLLAADCRLEDDAVRKSAHKRLAALWRNCGLSRDATRLTARTAATRDHHPAARIARAEIEQQVVESRPASDGVRAVEESVEELLSPKRAYSRHPAGARVLFNRGLRGGADRKYAFSVVDLNEPALVADLRPLAARVWKSGNTARYDACHFIPIAGQDDVHGISLLEGRILWSVSNASHRTGSKPQIGPYAPEFCILQSHETVTALHPSDGRVLWRRTDIPYDAGLVRDEATGMLADDTALVIFDSDLAAFRLLDPRSGELLKTGVLEPSSEPRRRGWAFGRRLLYVTRGDDPRLRLWDPACDDAVLDEPCRDRCLVDAGLGSGLAAVLNGRQLSILDTRTAERVWETEIAEESASSTRQIRAVCESGRYCIHLEQDVADSPTSQATHDFDGVRNLPLSGTLFVIDRRSGEHWSRAMPRCNLLLFPTDDLPALMTVGRIRDGHSRRGIGLVMEVIDGASGRTLTRRDDLTRRNKMFLHSRFDADQQTLVLRGRDSRISVRLTSE